MTVPKKPNINDILGTSIVEGGGKGGGFGVDFSSFKNWWNKKATEKALKKLKIQRKKQREEVEKELSSKVKVAQEGLEGFNKSMKEKNQADLAEYYRLKTDGRISVDPEVKKIITPKTPEQYKLDLKKAKKKGEKASPNYKIEVKEKKDLSHWKHKHNRHSEVDKRLAKHNISFDFKYVNDPGMEATRAKDRQMFLDMGLTEDQLKNAHLMMDPNAVTNETFNKWFNSLPVGSRL